MRPWCGRRLMEGKADSSGGADVDTTRGDRRRWWPGRSRHRLPPGPSGTGLHHPRGGRRAGRRMARAVGVTEAVHVCALRLASRTAVPGRPGPVPHPRRGRRLSQRLRRPLPASGPAGQPGALAATTRRLRAGGGRPLVRGGPGSGRDGTVPDTPDPGMRRAPERRGHPAAQQLLPRPRRRAARPRGGRRRRQQRLPDRCRPGGHPRGPSRDRVATGAAAATDPRTRPLLVPRRGRNAAADPGVAPGPSPRGSRGHPDRFLSAAPPPPARRDPARARHRRRGQRRPVRRRLGGGGEHGHLGNRLPPRPVLDRPPRARHRGRSGPQPRGHHRTRAVRPRPDLAAHPRVGTPGLGQGRRRVPRPADRRLPRGAIRAQPSTSSESSDLRQARRATEGATDMASSQQHFTTDVTGLPSVGRTEVVELSDGDRYELRIAPVAKRVGDATARMLAYNGSIPGPTLRVQQGAHILVDIENQGDMEGTVHWHGLRLDNRYDGTHQTQAPIEVGGRFTAVIKCPDPGAYWYHPHIRSDYGIEMGLYGGIVVEADDPDYWPPVHRELFLTLDDLLLEEGRVSQFSREETTHAAMGRFGNVILVNGETDLALTARRGEVLRLYLLNTANTRVFNVGIPGARIKLVGGDSGHVEQEEWVEEVVIAPSERVVVDVMFEAAGEFALQHRTPDRVYPLAVLTVQPEP